MADEGLFSNLRFTDVLFPAIATAASAYSPYAARGLNSGMNLFNTMAQFQNDTRRWKSINAEEKRLKEALEQGQVAAGEYLSPIEGRQEEIKRRYTEAYRDELDYPQGAEGATIASVPEPMSEEDFKQAMQESMTPGSEDKWALGVPPDQQAGLVGDPAGSFQGEMAASAPPKFTEAAPWYLEQQVERGLFDDPEYQALGRESALTKLMGGTMALSPGSAVATLGNSALGSQDLAQEKQRMIETIQGQDAYAENQFLRNQELKILETAEQKERAHNYALADAEKKQNWVEAATQIKNLSGDDIDGMNSKDLFTLKSRTNALIMQATQWGEAANPIVLADLYATLEYLNSKLAPGGANIVQNSGQAATAGVSTVTSDFLGN